MAFGMSPGADDYKIAIDQWLEFGLTPLYMAQEAEIDRSAREVEANQWLTI